MQLKRFRRVQNNAARFAARVPRPDPITPVLSELHWLSCELRIRFRISTYIYKCTHNLAPQYLVDVIQTYTPHRNPQSAS